ncbi:efflux RND transporter permease subunit [Helicobacter himalayensis]|uniref:efflux RND transporter permease subunit n=1 Tax=Helicobacter himalayensis TaxID=1591088 RepID=UPI000835874F|nr:efflux RND transporter permease subunit [Helicobacter himalayensis]
MKQALLFFLKNPMVAFVCVVFMLLFGIMGLKNMPYQLLPQVTRPTISVYTNWSGATPFEIEKEIINRQEKALKGIEGLVTLTSTARQSRAIVGLEFSPEIDVNFALLKVSAKIDEIKGYPLDVDKPTIAISGENIPPAIYLFLRTLPENEREVDTYKTFFEDYILGRLERVNGVGEVFYPSGRATQMQILLDSKALAFHSISIAEVIDSIKTHNQNTTAGSLDYGLRSYRIKVESQYTDTNAILKTPIKQSGGQILYLQDIAVVSVGFAKQTSYGYVNDTRALSVQIVPTPNANILELTQNMRAVVSELNSSILHNQGLEFVWSRDQEGYILDSIAQVKNNILLGIVLACAVLYVFLRSVQSTLVVLVCIPICIISSFFLLDFSHRTLNVITLAGVSFAMSMLIDNAIVVVENISRHLQMKKSAFQACVDGTLEVVGAIFASVITTIAIFIPILNMQEDIGQLFSDIALSVCFGLIISFFVSLFIIPSAQFVLLEKFGTICPQNFAFLQKLSFFGQNLSQKLIRILSKILTSSKHCVLFIVGFLGLSVIVSIALMPKLDYLPRGNENLLIGYINTPPGISYENRKEIGQAIFEQNKHLIRDLGYTQKSPQDLPPIEHLFFASNESYMQLGLTSSNPAEVKRLIPQIRQSIANIPDVQASIVQQGIFDKGASTQSIYIYVVGESLDSVNATASVLNSAIKKQMPYMQTRPLPALENNVRELVLYPNNVTLSLNGFNAKSFGQIVDVVLGGKEIDEFKTPSGKTIDLVLKALPDLSPPSIAHALEGEDFDAPEEFANTQITTPNGKLLPLSVLTDIKQEYSMSQIRHYERERSILLVLNSPPEMPLEQILSTLQNEVIAPLKKAGELRDNRLIFGGAAKDIDSSRGDLLAGFGLALLITYLILCALYGNFSYPFIIIFSVPFAVAGGLLGLGILNLFDNVNLDMLSLLGFIILVGSVVNNAILIVYQTKYNLIYGKNVLDSIIEATQSRLRPICMSIFTSVFGLLPLVVIVGSGSEIYRALGAVLVGGLLFSGLLSLFIIPCALRVYFAIQKIELKVFCKKNLVLFKNLAQQILFKIQKSRKM